MSLPLLLFQQEGISSCSSKMLEILLHSTFMIVYSIFKWHFHAHSRLGARSSELRRLGNRPFDARAWNSPESLSLEVFLGCCRKENYPSEPRLTGTIDEFLIKPRAYAGIAQ